MRVATSGQMAAIDRDTIASGVPGLELMERAGREMTFALLDAFPDLDPPAGVAVLCGKGNNGGGGLVVARRLDELGFEVTVVMLAGPDDLSPDARANFDRLPVDVEIRTPDRSEWAEEVARLCVENDVLVDAVFGTGITPPLRRDHAELFAAVDRRVITVASLDMPSGVSGDDGTVDPVAVRADVTLTVGLPKLGLLLPPGRDHAGTVTVLDIGFPDEICAAHASDLDSPTADEIAALLPPRPGGLHKYSAGTALVTAGSDRYGGAALLAAHGALRSGAGLITLVLPDRHAPTALGYAPEALVRGLPEGDGGGMADPGSAGLADLLGRQAAWGIGPGLGDDPATAAWVVAALQRTALPVVVDADALRAFGRTGSELRFGAERAILTPHAGELADLCGVGVTEAVVDRFDLASQLAGRTGAVVVAKGAPTLVAGPDGERVLNPTGHDALAHGGTGDVLTGLLTGLLAQGLDALDAAVLGCWLHGRAGELCADDGTRRSVLAREVADRLPDAFAELEWLSGEAVR